MKKYFKILLVFAGLILLLTGCENKSLYSMKTDLSNEKGLKKLIGSMDWVPYKLEDYKLRNKNLEIKVSGEPDISQDESFKKTFINGVILLVLTDAEEAVASLQEPREEAIEEDDEADAADVPTVGETEGEDEE